MSGFLDRVGGRAMAGGKRVTEARIRVLALALIYGDAEKPAESGGSEPPRAISRKTACTCDQKPCSCPKGDVNYAFLHATGKGGSRGPCSAQPTAANREWVPRALPEDLS